MPDITMCGSISCPMRYVCYRNQCSGTQPKEFRQAYFVFDPWDAAAHKCDYLVDISEGHDGQVD